MRNVNLFANKMSIRSSWDGPSECHLHNVIGDELVSKFQYEEALKEYQSAVECFEKWIDYTQPPRTTNTKTLITDFIRQIQNKIKVVERLILSKTKRKSIKSQYKIEDLKNYSEKEWTELPLFDLIQISDAYQIPISQEESNLDQMKYKFYEDFTSKYNPQLKNLKQLEAIVLFLISEGNYDQVLNFLNISPTLNEIIEKNVLNKVFNVSLIRIEKFTKHLGDDIIFAIDWCSYFIKLTRTQKKEIKKTLFDLFKNKLEKLGFMIYKGKAYRVKKLTTAEIKEIIRSMNVYLRNLIAGRPESDLEKYNKRKKSNFANSIIDSIKESSLFKNDQECIYRHVLPKEFFGLTLENIERMLINNQNYISLIWQGNTV